MLVRFIPGDSIIFADKNALEDIYHLTPDKLYYYVSIIDNKKSEIKLGRPKQYITIINDIGEPIELNMSYFKLISDERNEKINLIIND